MSRKYGVHVPLRPSRSIAPLASASLAALILLILIGASVFNSRVVSQATSVASDLQTAELARSDSLRMQLVEANSLLMYAATGERSALSGYARVHPALGPRLQELRATLLHSHLTTLAQRASTMIALNARWERTIARPSFRATPRQAARLQLQGQPILDEMRASSMILRDALTLRIQSVAGDSLKTLRTSGWIALALIVVVAFAVVLFAGYRSRLSQELEASRRVADAFARAQLPNELPVTAAVRFDATYAAAEDLAVIGGDWYDVFEMGDGRFAFSLGDVTGHGLDAAVVMSRVRHAIRALASVESDPATILEKANRVLRLQGDQMVTALCGTYDARNGHLVYASAGHPPALIAGVDGSVRTLRSEAPPLGIIDTVDAPSNVEVLAPGEAFIAYTDGIVENERDFVRGERRLHEVVGSLAFETAANPADAIRERILGTRSGRDDIAILVIIRPAAASLSQDAYANGVNVQRISA